jgi:hypothetical protein
VHILWKDVEKGGGHHHENHIQIKGLMMRSSLFKSRHCEKKEEEEEGKKEKAEKEMKKRRSASTEKPIKIQGEGTQGPQEGYSS